MLHIGVAEPELVEACHIVDWSEDEVNRTNPRNGLCLNPFFHKAYDKFFISITPDFEIKISDRLLSGLDDDSTLNYLRQYVGAQIHLPDKFLPQREFLEIHHNKY